ncbi:MAG: glycosyltransferase [Alistipes sp.]|nr:glycosyltransferase [Alistipes sp.]
MEISVIIPVYNVEKYIERCIRSILDQTFQDFEVILVNDGSTDRSMEIVEKFARVDNRFVILHNPKNMGLMWTRKVGYDKAKGKYFVFCDSDDYLPSNSLEKLYNVITDSRASIVAGGVQYVSDKKQLAKRYNKLSYGSDSEAVYKSLLTGELLHNLWGKIFDRKLFDQPLDTFEGITNGEDGIVFYQLGSRIENIITVEEIIYYYYINAGSATRQRLSDKALAQKLFSYRYISDYLKSNCFALSDYVKCWEIRVLEGLKMSGVKKKELDFLDVKSVSTYRSINSYKKGCKGAVLYLKINSTLFRHVLRNLQKFKNFYRKFAG